MMRCLLFLARSGLHRTGRGGKAAVRHVGAACGVDRGAARAPVPRPRLRGGGVRHAYRSRRQPPAHRRRASRAHPQKRGNLRLPAAFGALHVAAARNLALRGRKEAQARHPLPEFALVRPRRPARICRLQDVPGADPAQLRRAADDHKLRRRKRPPDDHASRLLHRGSRRRRGAATAPASFAPARAFPPPTSTAPMPRATPCSSICSPTTTGRCAPAPPATIAATMPS